ncbi:MAG: hypothetical protein IKE17_09915 [Clostridia bacterium]|nr:hypothetical protein [Clostridia bacterium]
MMMKTKALCLTLCLALLMAALPLALGEADAPTQTRRLRLGSSIYTLEIDESFQYGDVTAADVEEGQVAYLYSDRFAVDFDVYQHSVPGDPRTLAEYVDMAAAAHPDASEIVADGEINGIPVGSYRATESYDGGEYQTLTYVLDNGDGYVEVVFWLDGEDAEALAQGMIGTLDFDNLAPVRLGTSPYWVFCSASFREGGMTSEDVAEGQVAYWVSDETLLDFDVYQRDKEGLPGDLADYVTQEAREYNASAVEPDATVNGIPVGWYRAVESYEGKDYETLTCAMDAGGDYIKVVFWLDGPTAAAEADGILQSLWREEDEPEEAGAAEALPEETAADGAATRTLRLGTSPFTIVVPAGFTEGEMTQEDIEDDQVAYYYSNETLLDFDVYQFSKDGYPNDLATYVEEETAGYNSVSEVVTDGEINGVPAAWYRTVEAYQDAEFNTLTYILDGGEEYVEICFWLDGENADAEADAIIRTLGVSPVAGTEEHAEGADAVETDESADVTGE